MKLFALGCLCAIAIILCRRLLAWLDREPVVHPKLTDLIQESGDYITDSDSRLIDFFRARQSARPEGDRAGGGETHHLLLNTVSHGGEQG